MMHKAHAIRKLAISCFGVEDSDSTDVSFVLERGADCGAVVINHQERTDLLLRVKDHSSLDTAFDGRDTQVTVGLGAVYNY
jgi:hypothetical protein